MKPLVRLRNIQMILALVFLLAAGHVTLAAGQADELYSPLAADGPSAPGEIAYVSLPGSDRIAMVDVSTLQVLGSIQTLPLGCDGPGTLALSPDGLYLYVVCHYPSNSVVILDTTTHGLVATVYNISNGGEIVFTPDGQYALVAYPYSDIITVIDAQSQTYAGQIVLPSYGINHLTVHPFANVVYAITGANRLHAIDMLTFSVQQTVDLSHPVTDIKTSPGGEWIYASYEEDNGIVELDAFTLADHRYITGTYYYAELAASSDGSRLYSPSASRLHVFDARRLVRLATVAITDGVSMDISCDGSRLFVTKEASSLYAVDTATLQLRYISLPGYTLGKGVAACTTPLSPRGYTFPHRQEKQSARHVVVTYEQRLINQTGATDSFDLSLEAADWPTSLSASQIGPLVDGAQATFTVSVTVPADVAWYSKDVFTVTVTSQANPALVDAARLTTQAYAPPDMSISPIPLMGSVAVGEMVTKTLSISNGNGVPLTYKLLEGELSQVNPNILLWSGHAKNVTEIRQALDQNISYNMQYLTTPYPGPAQMQSALQGKDVFLVPPHYTDTYTELYDIGVSLADVLQDFAAGGGSVIVLDACNVTNGLLRGSGLLNAVWGGCAEWAAPVEVTQAEHRYMDGIPPVFSVEAAWGAFTPLNADELLQAQATGSSVVAARSYGQGTVGLLGFDFNAYNAEMARLLSNAAGMYFPFDVPWLSLAPLTGTVPSLSTANIKVVFDARQLSTGQYDHSVVVKSNDPAVPSLSIPVRLYVGVRAAGTELTPASQGGEGWRGERVSYPVRVTNLGNIDDSFTLQSASGWASELSHPSTPVLAPLESFTVTLSVDIPIDAADGITSTILLTATSVEDSSVTASAGAVTTARQWWAEPSLEPALQNGQGFPAQTPSYMFTLTNLGNRTDSFSLESETLWPAVLSTASSGPLAPGERFSFTLDVTIPAGAAGGSSDTALLRAVSLLDPGQVATAQAHTRAERAGVGLLGPASGGSGGAGETLTYSFVLNNAGTLSDTFTLTAGGAWVSGLSTTSSGLLAPGENFTVTLRVTIPANAVDGSQDTATLTAVSGLDESMVMRVDVTTTADVPSPTPTPPPPTPTPPPPGESLYLPVVKKLID